MPFSTNSNYQAVIRALLQMHRLSVAGRFESPEADSIRDAMDAPWEALDDVERKRLKGLSEDLNAITEVPSEQAPTEQELQVMANRYKIIHEVYQSQMHGDWDKALELLRRKGKYLPPAMLSYLRGQIWQEAGDAVTAVVFLEHASSLEPENVGSESANLIE